MALTRVEDVIVPELFTARAIQATAEQSVLVQSGAVVQSPELNSFLAGGGLTETVSFFNDLTRIESNISSDEEDDFYTGGSNNSVPRKITSASEVQVRQSRNASWSAADLAADLSATDPMAAIASRVGAFWAWDIEKSLIASLNGVFADNDAAPVGTEHAEGDLTNDISGDTYSAGTTDIGGGAFIDAVATMGDAMGQLSLMMVHSLVYARLVKQNAIDFIRPSDNSPMIATYQGKQITMSDAMPNADGVFETWIFGPGAIQLGLGSPTTPTEVSRMPDSGNGGGSTVLFNRMERCIHPVGHKYAGALAKGGPSNAVLANGASWERAFAERKQIRMARLVTREYAVPPPA